ncbi:MAG: hypothetical protein P8H17_04445, partial [Flavobacteriales bacterium]|nr:hypothetical protein [Flavobacteriales bacterium]
MRRLSEFIYWVSGWKAVGEREFPDKCIVVPKTGKNNSPFIRYFGTIPIIYVKHLPNTKSQLEVCGAETTK